MQATTHTPSRVRVSRQHGLIAVTILAAAALAAAVVRFEAPALAGAAIAQPQGRVASTLPVSAVVESACRSDPSVPRASAVFRDSSFAAEELSPTF